MDIKDIKKYGINKYNCLNNRITAKEYNKLILELPSIEKYSLLCNEIEEIEREYMEILEANNKDNLDEYLRELTQIYNDKIRGKNKNDNIKTKKL